MLSNALREIRQALRALAKTPSFTLTAVGTLGLAIGASAAIFTVIETVLLDPLPYADSDRLVMLQGSAPGTDYNEGAGLAPEFLIEYKAQADLLENVGAYNLFTSTLRTDERVERVLMSSPTLTLFETLGATPQLGRLPTAEDGQLVAVLSHDLWMEWFGGSPDVVGRSYQIAGARRTVVGVMGPDFDFPSETVRLWFPNNVMANPQITPGGFGLPIVARVKPGVDREVLLAQLAAIASRLPEKYGGSPAYREIIERFVPRVVPLEEVLLGPLARPLWILLGAMAILLAIACANVANLFLARTERQRRDIAVRHAIGAARSRLIRRQLVETTLVALVAGALSVGLAALLIPVIVAQAPFPVPRLSNTELSFTTLLFTFGVSVAAGLACGIVPALRTAGVSPAWLRDATRSSTYGRRWTRDGLVMVQAAFALLLLVGSGLLLRSFVALRNVDPGYVTQDIFTFQFAPEQESLRGAVAWANFHLAFMERLRQLPGVETVGIVENFPLNETALVTAFSTEERAAEGASEYALGLTFAAGDYFEAMGIELKRGRDFTEAEQLQNPGHVLVSESTAARLWPGEDPIGKVVTVNQFGLRETVIGVVEDVRQNDFRNAAGPGVYFPMVLQRPEINALSTPAYVLRTSRAASIARDVRALIDEVAPEAPMYRVYTIEQLVGDSMARLSFTLIALGLAAGLALFLGMVGLYGILASTVAERTRELGIRIALGADPARVRRMVVVQGLRVVALGVAVGIAGALFGARALEGLLYGVQGLDVVTLVGTSAVMLIVGAVASWVPAYRASSVDPVATLAES